MQALINYIDKYTMQIFVFQVGLLVILMGIILWVYFFNRKKYHNLKHQIPASVVKNYLDSIIQNSTSLKSSLFRGGGLEVDPASIPSVMPLDQLPASTPIQTVSSGGDEALQAEIAKLQSQLSEKNKIISELENKNTEYTGEIKNKDEKILELEGLLAKSGETSSEGGASEELQAELEKVTAERDSLKEDLAQYDIIEDDLADLKRLKQENEQLKSSLGASSEGNVSEEEEVKEKVAEATDNTEASAQPAPALEAVSSSADSVAAAPEDSVKTEEEQPEVAETEVEASEQANPETTSEESAEAQVAKSEESTETNEDDKSPEDLLSEFEKMLG